MSHVLLQSEDRRGGKHIEAVAAALASQMGAKFLPVDPMLLALLLAEGLGGGPERYINLVRGGTGSSTARSSGAGGSARSESKIRFAWQALRQGLSAGGTPTVVFLRSADSLICSSWDTYEAFMDVFGPRSQEMHALAGGTPAPMAVLLAGVILPETGAALVSAGSKASGSEGPGPLEKDGWKKDASYKAALGGEAMP